MRKVMFYTHIIYDIFLIKPNKNVFFYEKRSPTMGFYIFTFTLHRLYYVVIQMIPYTLSGGTL